MEVDAKASLDTCEEAPQPQDELPQPKPRKKKKAAKRPGKWLLYVYRLPEYAQIIKHSDCFLYVVNE